MPPDDATARAAADPHDIRLYPSRHEHVDIQCDKCGWATLWDGGSLAELNEIAENHPCPGDQGADSAAENAAGRRGPKVPEGAGFFAPTDPMPSAARQRQTLWANNTGDGEGDSSADVRTMRDLDHEQAERGTTGHAADHTCCGCVPSCLTAITKLREANELLRAAQPAGGAPGRCPRCQGPHDEAECAWTPCESSPCPTCPPAAAPAAATRPNPPPCPHDVEAEAERVAAAEYDRMAGTYGDPPRWRWPMRVALAVAWRRGYQAGARETGQTT